MRRSVVTGLIVLALLAGLLAIGDRAGKGIAQDQIAKKVAAQYRLARQPKVSIKGFPFLTQAIGGHYGEITIDVGDLTRQDIRLTGVSVTLARVAAPMSAALNGDASGFVAGTATTVATIGYAELNRHAPPGTKVSPNGDTLQVRGPAPILGVTRQVTAVVRVVAAGRDVELIPQSAQTSGVAVPVLLVRSALTVTLPVRGLPVGTEIGHVEVRPEGLRVSAVARDVKLSQLDGTGASTGG